MSSSQSPEKFEERKHITQVRARFGALVGPKKTEEIYQRAVSEASQGGHVDQTALLAAMELAYDHEATRDSRP